MTNEQLEDALRIANLKAESALKERERYWQHMCSANRIRHCAEVKMEQMRKEIDKLREKAPKKIRVVIKHIDPKEVTELRSEIIYLRKQIYNLTDLLNLERDRYRPKAKDFVMIVEPFGVTDSDELHVHPSVEQVARYARLTHV